MDNNGLTPEQIENIAKALIELRHRIPCLPEYKFVWSDRIFNPEKNDDNGRE